MRIELGELVIQDYQRINILLGKNGSGKSTTLKEITKQLRAQSNRLVEYITPERGGALAYQPGVEGNMQNSMWSTQVRSKNQFAQFKEQTVVIFKDLRAQVNAELEEQIANYPATESNIPRGELDAYLFNKNYVTKINSLLDHVEIREDKSTFKIYSKETKEPISPEDISSGESELITLGIECLAFGARCEKGKDSFLLIDSPDVHIHPDLQYRLMQFLIELVESKKFTILIATHSTALIGALDGYEHVGVEFFSRGKKEIHFKTISEEYKNILPIFGAHPLSNMYYQRPIFLVEGDDDAWLWQQAIKTSGTLKIYPCSVFGEGNMLAYENKVNELILSVYDSPATKGYSLRDKDEHLDSNIDTPPSLSKVERFRLSCRCAENLLLSDDVLAQAGTNWEVLKIELDNWIKNNPSHKKFNQMNAFKENGYDRKQYPTKEINNIITGIITTKPWQALVGQVIGLKIKEGKLGIEVNNENSLDSYLGEPLINFLSNHK